MRVFSLKTCDTCRKALRELREMGHDPQIIDVRSDGVSAADLALFLQKFGEDLLNRRSTTWRGLSGNERTEAPLDLLGRYPTLMKRPVIEVDGQLFLGWGDETPAALLG
jgi:arsenate reductase